LVERSSFGEEALRDLIIGVHRLAAPGDFLG
jgi:hypothetical protein